jgi:hypothetical protein
MLTSQEVLALAAERWERGEHGDTERITVSVSEWRTTFASMNRCDITVHVHVKDSCGGDHTACEDIGKSKGVDANWDEAWERAQRQAGAVIEETFGQVRMKAGLADARRKRETKAGHAGS